MNEIKDKGLFFRLPAELHKKLCFLSVELETTMGKIVLEALEKHVKELRKEK